MLIRVERSGPGLSLQDAGRPGWRCYGVPEGGAMDRLGLRAANGLLLNPANAPVLEIVGRGARVTVLEAGWLALAGAASCRQLAPWTAAFFPAASTLDFTADGPGLFAYLAAPGGWQAEHWFGSCSVDPRLELGRATVRGDCLAANGPPRQYPRVRTRVWAGERGAEAGEKTYLSLLPGPQFESFTAEARELLVATPWTVSARSDRTGFRLEGPALEVPESIPSEPVLPGSIQVPGGGQPIVTMVDGPTVGGYPKIALLPTRDRQRLAQCAPGAQLVFRWSE